MKTNSRSFLQYEPLYCVVGGLLAYFEPVRQSFLGVLVLGGLIALYAWLSPKKNNVERVESADNCYFIGFIYTLLVIALSVWLDAKNIRTADGLDKFLKTIGIAFGTSVIGMIFRLVLTHKVEVPEDEFARAVSKIAQAAYRLEGGATAMEESGKKMTSSIDGVVTAMISYERRIHEHIEKICDESDKIGEHLGGITEDLIKGFSERIADTLQKNHFDSVRETLEQTAEEYHVSVNKISKMLEKSSADLSNAGETAIANAEETSRVFDKLHSSMATMPDKMSGAVQSSMDALQKELTARLSDINESVSVPIQSLQNTFNADQMQAVTNAMNEFSTQIENMNGGLRKIAAQQDAIMAAASGDVDNLRKMRDAFAQLADDMRNDVKTAGTIKEEYRKEFQKAAEAALSETHQLYARLIGGAQIALSQMDNLGSLTDSLQKIAQKLEKMDK